MKKNNKGFFLAETIVMIALVTSIMAFVYPNVSKLYENYKDRAVYYDQTEDIYKLKYVYDYLLNNGYISFYISYFESSADAESNEIYHIPCHYAGNAMAEEMNNNVNKFIYGNDQICGTNNNSKLNLKKLYIAKYLINGSVTKNDLTTTVLGSDVSDNDLYEFNKYIKRLKKTTYDTSSYRLIGIFEYGEGENKITRYASIKIDNPNSISTVGDDNE